MQRAIVIENFLTAEYLIQKGESPFLIEPEVRENFYAVLLCPNGRSALRYQEILKQLNKYVDQNGNTIFSYLNTDQLKKIFETTHINDKTKKNYRLWWLFT